MRIFWTRKAEWEFYADTMLRSANVCRRLVSPAEAAKIEQFMKDFGPKSADYLPSERSEAALPNPPVTR